MEKSEIGNFCIIGFPDDLGVKNVNGRLGAEAGPQAFLEAFGRLKGRSPVLNRMLDPIMVNVGDDIEENHDRATQAVALARGDWLKKNGTLLVVGGGHDYAYSWLRGVSESRLPKKKRIACINLDAHFDLRIYHPLMTSGSPFRRLIEEKYLNPAYFVEFGIQSHCNQEELFQYAKNKKIKTLTFDQLRNGKAVPAFKRELQRLRKICDEIVISVDLDSLSFAFCPGVSAPQAEGFSGSELFQMLELAGSDKKVTSLGIFELAPPLDVQNLTTRLAVQAAWHFLDAKYFP